MRKRAKKRVAPARALVIDIRDQRLSGGRLSISARTDDELVRSTRELAVRKLLDMGEDGLAVLELIRARRVRIERATEAVQRGAVAELLSEAARAEAPKGANPMFLGATVDRFLTRVSGGGKARRTLEHYTMLARHLERTLGVVRKDERVVRDVDMASVTTADAEAWLHGPKETNDNQPWSPRTQSVAHAVARQIWALAITEDEDRSERENTPRTLTRNIWGVGRVRPPRVRKTRVVFLSREQAGQLLWAMRGRPQAVLMALGLYAGLRATEATNLRLGQDVDLEAGVLRIQPRTGVYAWRPKSDNSVRDVPIHPRLARWIRAHIHADYAGQTYLIHPVGGDRPIERSSVQAWTKLAFEAAGIPYGRESGAATYHTLRHTFASWLAQRDVQLRKIALLMGDRTEQIDRTYAHLTPSDLRAALARLV